MQTAVYILAYIVGCILAYGRVLASFYVIEEDYIDYIPCYYDKWYGNSFIIISSLLSWIGVLAGACDYFTSPDEKYLFKWSFKPLMKYHKWAK